MHLSKTTVGMVAGALDRSRKMLHKAQEQIAKCRAGLDSLAEISSRAGVVVRDYDQFSGRR